jgi:hypothetical protein
MAGAKKLPLPALAKKGCADWVAVFDVVLDDFSALVFIVLTHR